MSNFCLENGNFLKLPEEIKIFWNFAGKESKFFTIFPEKLKFFKNLPEKIEIFREIVWKKRNFSEICREKLKFCWPGSTTSSQISNQIDAAGTRRCMEPINIIFSVTLQIMKKIMRGWWWRIRDNDENKADEKTTEEDFKKPNKNLEETAEIKRWWRKIEWMWRGRRSWGGRNRRKRRL